MSHFAANLEVLPAPQRRLWPELASVLARHAPELSCWAVHAQANREPERARFRRALERCGAAGP